MTPRPYLTIGEIAETFDVPEWLARRAVDALATEIPRAGQYRLVPRHALPKVAAEIERRRQASKEANPR